MAEELLPIVKQFVTYLYTTEYDDEDSSPPEIPRWEGSHRTKRIATGKPAMDAMITAVEKYEYSLFFNIKMYVFAEKYDVPALKILATEKYKKLV
jgi:hypothetical protein